MFYLAYEDIDMIDVTIGVYTEETIPDGYEVIDMSFDSIDDAEAFMTVILGDPDSDTYRLIYDPDNLRESSVIPSRESMVPYLSLPEVNLVWGAGYSTYEEAVDGRLSLLHALHV